MAVGGVPELSELTAAGIDENREEQEQEIEVLLSIYEGQDSRVEILSRSGGSGEDGASYDQQNMLKLYVPVVYGNKVPVDVFLPLESESTGATNGVTSPSGVQLARSDSGQRVIWNFPVTFLPPLVIQASLPPTYPSHTAPDYVVTCPWLSPAQLSLVCRELDGQWEKMKEDGGGRGMSILFTWMDWLTENLTRLIGYEDHVYVSAYEVDQDVDDCRVIVEPMDLNDIITHLMRFNRAEELRQFYNDIQCCEICYEEGQGSKFVLIPECGHFMCRECLTAHCELLVKEGNVLNILCPMSECKSHIPAFVLKEILSKEDFDRFDSLSLQKALNVMSDVTWCPRCNKPVICEPEQNLSLAICLNCMFTFCTMCMERSHQGEECEKARTEREKQAADSELRRMKGEVTIGMRKREREKKLENKRSDNYILEMTKNCPLCKSPIMKTGGCNKVTCGSCSGYMCWVCVRPIRGYDHFANNPACNTFTIEQDRMIDNQDLAQFNFDYMHIPVPPPRRERVRNQGNEIKDRLAANPGLKNDLAYCVTCRQPNLRENQNNHVRCWSCKASFCMHCNSKISGPVGRHYAGQGSCPQHSS
ncbi:E3 ubiquitin-protein ligase RNF14-like [Mya arenaria]|uniref:E3 ubiquitin-protein ligase RNF14-like n=1 Tax=Mya arenaria TaxID=6604 RepID=UPI0022E330DF|nr:E3 ubiquitin-protein ligase RNF14-like [Mya arenaria]